MRLPFDGILYLSAKSSFGDSLESAFFGALTSVDAFFIYKEYAMESLNQSITSEKLEQIGQNIYKFAKLGMIAGLCAIALMFIIGLISVGTGAYFISPFIFEIADIFAFAYPFVIVDYLALIWGLASIPMYFVGLKIFALGRIAHNTEKN